nr:hypothetical protein [Tanacetum cinerariifolium]
MLVAVPFHNLEFRDSNDLPLGIYIASRFLVNSETIKLLKFTPPVIDSPKGMLVIVYWLLYPHSPMHQVFNPLDMPVICCLCLCNVPAEDEAPIEAYIPEVASVPTPPLPPSFLSPCIRPPHTRAAMAQMRAAVPSTYHLLLPSGTPPLLPIPLPVPSTNRRAKIPEADMLPRKRLLLTAPRPRCEVGESSAAVARQLGPTMARSVDCSFVDCGT